MKKLLVFSIVALLAAGCSSFQQASNQNPTPVIQNTNPYAHCNITDARLKEKVLANTSNKEVVLSELLSTLQASCNYNNLTDRGNLVDGQGNSIILFAQSCGGVAIAPPGSNNNPVAKGTVVINVDSHCQPGSENIP